MFTGGNTIFGQRRNRPLLNNNVSQSMRQMLDLDIKLLGNFIGFLEYIKVIFEQKGFVASGLSAQVVVARKPVNFFAKPKPAA
jgi:hypothetical protein